MQPKRPNKDGYTTRSKPSERAILLDSDSDNDGDEIFGYSRSNSDPNRYDKQADSGLSKVKADILSVTKTMQNNMSKVLDRGDKLEELQDKTEDLNVNAFQFVNGSRKLQRKMWWQNFRLKLLFGFIVIALFLILILSLVLKRKKS